VDSGSTDISLEIIKSYVEKDAMVKLIVKNDANIAEGRNIAIKNALTGYHVL
jgi:glycosyltransferase involved in cell wall biosynthesis